MTGYLVRFVEDDDLPADHEWAMVSAQGQVVLFLKRSALPSERILSEAWAGYRKLLRSKPELQVA